MKFERLQDKLTSGQFVARRHYCITDRVFDYVEDEQLKLKKKNRKEYPTKADIYYQLIIEGLKHADKVTFQNLPKNHTVRIKLGNPINNKLFKVQDKIESEDFSSMRGYRKNGKMQTINIFSVAVCLMEAAIDNQ
jgi:hypothetical protein